MQDTFNKRDFMSVGVEERTLKTLEIDDAGSIIMVRNGIRMSPLKLENLKATALVETPEPESDDILQENSEERLDLKQRTLAKAI
jgi:hypothetical protein